MKTFFAILIFLLSNAFFAQQPKIGLVLSGGGAKGFAHIGVIRQLEALGIYPDIVTGTSMGSIVGALYAMGYTPDQMEDIVREQEWDRILSNSLRYNKVVISEKEYDSRYFLEVGVEKGKIKFPQGLIQGKELTLLLDKITIPAHSIKDFSKLPIPFACVATDITTGEPVVMKSGNINEAIRASMAIPSVFTPVRYDGHLCVDGGIVRNFPVQEALDMGAEVIIGSYVSGGFLQEDDLNSIIDVLFQTTTVMGNFDSQEQMKLVDVLIEPNVDRISGADFAKGEAIIEKGDSIVKVQSEQIMNTLIAKGVQVEALEKPISLVKDSVFLIDAVELKGNVTISDRSIEKHMHFSTKNKYSATEISDNMTKLYGTKYFSELNYTLEQYTDTSYAIKVKVVEEYQTQLKFALHYDTENGVGFNTNLSFRNVIFPFTKMVTELDLANYMRARTVYQFFIGRRQRNSVELSGLWHEYETPLFKQDAKYSILETNRFEFALGLRRAISLNTVLGVDAGYFMFNYVPEITQNGFNDLNKINSQAPFVKLFYKHNNTNHRYFATKGGDFALSFQYAQSIKTTQYATDTTSGQNLETASLSNMFLTRAKLKRYVQLSKRSSVSIGFHLNYNLVPSNELLEAAYVGGVNPYFYNTIHFPGAKAYQYTPTNVMVAHFHYQYELFPDFYLQPGIYYGETELVFQFLPNYNSQTERFGGRSRQFGTEFKMSYESAIGPIYFSIAKGLNDMDFLTNFGVGFWYK